MGLYIYLYARQQEIGEEAWAQVFDESLELLKCYPLPLIGLKGAETKWGKRLMFSPVEFRKDDHFGEYWRVEGDSLSGRRAESFILQRQFSDDEKRRPNKYNHSRSILWQDINTIDHSDVDGRTIFQEKTQGYPFHCAMLAVGMLFESRFPGKVLVQGDVTVGQAKMVKKWADGLLKEPLAMPIIMDEVRLWEQLMQDYKGDYSLVMERFSTLYRGVCTSMEAFVRMGVDDERLEALLSEQLSGDVLGTIYAAHRVDPLIDTMGLPKLLGMLHRISEKRPKEKRFNFTDFAESLATKYITFDEKAKDLLRDFRPSRSVLSNIDETIGGALAKMIGFSAPKIFTAMVDRNEFLARFRPLVEKVDQLELKVNKAIAHCEESLDFARKMKAKRAEEGDLNDAANEDHLKAESAVEDPTSNDDFILCEARRQLIVQHSPQEWDQILENVRWIIQEGYDRHEFFRELGSHRDQLMIDLYEKVRESRFAPLESSWIYLESEEVEVELLIALLIFLIVFEGSNLERCQLREYVFNHPELWPFLVKENHQKL